MRQTLLSSTCCRSVSLQKHETGCRVLGNGCSGLEGRVVQLSFHSGLIDSPLISLQQQVTSVPRLPALTQRLRAAGIKS